MQGKGIRAVLHEIEIYFRSNGQNSASLPRLKFHDKDGDGRIDLFGPPGHRYESKYQEVPREWAEVLWPIANNHQESSGVELSLEDWMAHKQSLKPSDSGRVVMPNGLQVIVEYDPGRPLVWIGFAVFAGSIDEKPRMPVSHALEHVIVGGGPLGNRKEIEEKMIGLGAHGAGASMTYDRTSYTLYSDPAHVDAAFMVWDQMLTNRYYDQRRVADEINGILLEELRRNQSDARTVAIERFSAGLYPGHPFGGQISGDIDAMKKLSVRDLIEYHDNTYVPNNIAVKFSGPITKDAALKIVMESKIGRMRPSIVERPNLTVAPQGHPTIEILASGTPEMPSTKVTEAFTGCRVLPWYNRADGASLEVAFYIIRERLQRELVKTGKINKAGIGEISAGGVGRIRLALSGSADKIPDALFDARRIVEEIKRYPAADAEVESAKRALLAEDLFDREAGKNRLMPELQNARYVDTVADRKLWLDGIRGSNSAKIQRAAQKHLAEFGSHTLIVLEEGRKQNEFVSGQKLLESMQAISSAGVDAPKNAAEEKTDFPEIRLPDDFQISMILAGNPETLSDGRLRYRLSNGVVVTHVPTVEGDVMAAALFSPFGSGSDPLGKEGLRELLKNNLFRGTSDIPLKAFRQEMDYLGARYGANNGREDFSILLESPNATFADAFQLLLHVVQNPRLGDDDLQKTRLQIKNDRMSMENDPVSMSTNIPEADLYPNKNAVRPIFGSDTALGCIAREDLNAYRRMLFDPRRLEITIGGRFPDKRALDKVLYALSLMTAADGLKIISDGPQPSMDQFPSSVVTVSNEEQRKSLGVIDKQTAVKYLPRKTAIDHLSITAVGPERNSPDFPYAAAFSVLYDDRLFYRLTYGMKVGRDNAKGYIYKTLLKNKTNEFSQNVLLSHEFECKPSEIGTVLADIRDEYDEATGHAPGAHGLTQDELRIRMQNERLDWLKSLESNIGKVKNSIEWDHHPWFFRETDGKIVEVRDREEVYRRLMNLPIDKVIEIGGGYFNPSRVRELTVVGQLP
ncbi:MAG: insulinase family protein [Pseudomonadota bacterium]